MHPIGLAQRTAQKKARVAHGACETPPGPVSMAPPSCNHDQHDQLQNVTANFRIPTLYYVLKVRCKTCAHRVLLYY